LRIYIICDTLYEIHKIRVINMSVLRYNKYKRTTYMSYSRKEKFKELIWFLVKNFDYELYETKLWKLAFFAETDFYEKYKDKITGVAYIKNNHGPTPDYKIAEKAISELIKEKKIVKGKDNTYKVVGDLEIKTLDNKALDSVRVSGEKYYKLSAGQISALAHRDPIYLAAENKNDILDFEFVFYRQEDAGEESESKEFEKLELSPKAAEGLLKVLSL